MNLIIIAIVVILYGTLIVTTYTNMKQIPITAKVLYIILGIIINVIITSILININIVEIQNKDAYRFIKNIDILIFTAVNGIVSMPTIAKNINNYKMKIINKQKMIRKIIFAIIIYFVILIIESSYIKGLKI